MGATISEQLLKVANDLSSLADNLIDNIADNAPDNTVPLDEIMEILAVSTRLHKLGLEFRTENELEPQL